VHAIVRPWFPPIVIHRLPPEPYGMTQAQRIALASVALRSIVPFEGGDRVLREAQLPSGGPAFDRKERQHLRSVRDYIAGLNLIHLLGIVALVVLAIVRRTRPIAREGLLAGATVTLGIAAFVGIYLAVSPISFLGGFHRFFFSGDSWRFAETETLRRVFPDRFWTDTAAVLGALVALQAAVLLGLAWLWRRQAIRAAPRTAAHAGS
jgi:hypothetical protein